jgi:glycosyltransferase involved in cell wall biosynthesis
MDIRHIPRPRIGYVGIIKSQLDLNLVLALARRHPKWSFVLVGPQRGVLGPVIRELSRLSNVYFLGYKHVSTLPAYTQHMDVCMLCYKIDGYTRYVYPLKLHEYLASGRPCVGSPIRSLQEYSNLIRLAETTEDWSGALENALTPEAQASEQVIARRQVAHQHDWTRLATKTASNMCGDITHLRFHRSSGCPNPDRTVR